ARPARGIPLEVHPDGNAETVSGSGHRGVRRRSRGSGRLRALARAAAAGVQACARTVRQRGIGGGRRLSRNGARQCRVGRAHGGAGVTTDVGARRGEAPAGRHLPVWPVGAGPKGHVRPAPLSAACGRCPHFGRWRRAGRRRLYNTGMLIKHAPDIRSSEITDKKLYLNRREFLAAAGITAAGVLAAGIAAEAKGAPHGRLLLNVSHAFPKPDEKINSWEDITSYNNFYEFGTDKDDPERNAGKLKTQ